MGFDQQRVPLVRKAFRDMRWRLADTRTSITNSRLGDSQFGCEGLAPRLAEPSARPAGGTARFRREEKPVLMPEAQQNPMLAPPIRGREPRWVVG